MLKRLYIRNFAIISELETTFSGSMNILTGETGAGKSILLGAISLLLGDRASADLIRSGADRALVEGTFSIRNPEWFSARMKAENLDWEGPELSIRREISAKGQNRIFLNDQVISLNLLKEIGDRLVDLHGQHDHQSLLNPDLQKQFLDDFCNHNEQLQSLSELWHNWQGQEKDLKKLKKERQSLLEKQELASFQLKELESAGLSEGEDEQLEKELNRLQHAEHLFQTSGSLSWQLTGDEEDNLHSRLTDVLKKLDDLAGIDQELKDFRNELQSAVISVKETGHFLKQYSERITVDPERLTEVRNRLDTINRLKKKYGPSLEDVIHTRETLRVSLNGNLNVDDRINQLENDLLKLRKGLADQCLVVSNRRKKAAEELKLAVLAHLAELGLSKARFEIRFLTETDADSLILFEGKPVKAKQDGWDQIEFMLAANAGEDLKPLAKTASGGEISRIMLAIKAATAETAGVNVLIFDEIDTGVSGKIASSVGVLLSRLAQSRQVFVISHLPQVASIPGDHFLVAKLEKNGMTESSLKKLSESDRETEIARLLSGETITDLSKAQARALIEQYQ